MTSISPNAVAITLISLNAVAMTLHSTLYYMAPNSVVQDRLILNQAKLNISGHNDFNLTNRAQICIINVTTNSWIICVNRPYHPSGRCRSPVGETSRVSMPPGRRNLPRLDTCRKAKAHPSLARRTK